MTGQSGWLSPEKSERADGKLYGKPSGGDRVGRVRWRAPGRVWRNVLSPRGFGYSTPEGIF